MARIADTECKHKSVITIDVWKGKPLKGPVVSACTQCGETLVIWRDRILYRTYTAPAILLGQGLDVLAVIKEFVDSQGSKKF
jgi:hypothetical protein